MAVTPVPSMAGIGNAFGQLPQLVGTSQGQLAAAQAAYQNMMQLLPTLIQMYQWNHPSTYQQAEMSADQARAGYYNEQTTSDQQKNQLAAQQDQFNDTLNAAKLQTTQANTNSEISYRNAEAQIAGLRAQISAGDLAVAQQNEQIKQQTLGLDALKASDQSSYDQLGRAVQVYTAAQNRYNNAYKNALTLYGKAYPTGGGPNLDQFLKQQKIVLPSQPTWNWAMSQVGGTAATPKAPSAPTTPTPKAAAPKGTAPKAAAPKTAKPGAPPKSGGGTNPGL